MNFLTKKQSFTARPRTFHNALVYSKSLFLSKKTHKTSSSRIFFTNQHQPKLEKSFFKNAYCHLFNCWCFFYIKVFSNTDFDCIIVLFQKCLDKDPSHRWTCQELLGHKYFDNFAIKVDDNDSQNIEPASRDKSRVRGSCF